jgi:iron(II)-dependent oxidoreductase
MHGIDSATAVVCDASAATVVAALEEARERTLTLIASISEDDLERVHSPLMSPLVWDLGHIAAYQDLWLVHRHGGRPLLREDLAAVYDAFETPRAHRGELPFLRLREARDYAREVHLRSVEAIERRGTGDGSIVDLVLRHEHQHNETMLQTIELARLPGVTVGEPDGADPAPVSASGGGPELIEIPGGPCTIGAPDEGFAYDNERSRHRVDLPAFLIGRTAVTNGDFLAFVLEGGYRRREWWSAAGWRWRGAEQIERPQGWSADLRSEWRLTGLAPLDPARPVVHLSWYEADAFARASGARLPTEAEWEKAASWDPARSRARRHPWGDEAPEPGRHAQIDQLCGGTAAAGSYPAGASPYGVLGMVGDVWEWTGSDFAAYPGFHPYPYREYSEVFFGSEYKVLRGGSWATRPTIAGATFRNWDLPQRRQIFAGVRLARDL